MVACGSTPGRGIIFQEQNSLGAQGRDERNEREEHLEKDESAHNNNRRRSN